MPRLRDLFRAIRRAGLWGFAKRVYGQIGEDNLLVWASSLAYSWLFAIFPFLIFLVTLVPYLPVHQEDVEIQVNKIIDKNLPQEAVVPVRTAVAEVLSRVLTNRHQGLLSTGLILTLWAASSGISTTMYALNVCYDVEENRSFFKQRGLAIMLTIVAAVLILLVLLLLPIGTLATNWLLNHGQWAAQWGIPISGTVIFLWNITRWTVALLLMFAVVSSVHYFGPVIKQRFRLLTPGAVFTIGCWIAMGLFFRFYAQGFARYNQTYGALGGVIVLLFVLYLDSVVLLVGAEINSEIDYVLRLPAGVTEVPAHDVPPHTEASLREKEEGEQKR